jgi:excisionase family DNA binding protein
MRARDAAAQLEIDVRTVYKLCAAGLLGHMRMGIGGGTIRIEQSDIDAYKAKAREAAARPREDASYSLTALRPCSRDRPLLR